MTPATKARKPLEGWTVDAGEFAMGGGIISLRWEFFTSSSRGLSGLNGRGWESATCERSDNALVLILVAADLISDKLHLNSKNISNPKYSSA